MFEFLIRGVVLSEATYKRFTKLYPAGAPPYIVQLAKTIEMEEMLLRSDSATLAFAEEVTGLPLGEAVNYLLRWALAQKSSTYKDVLPVILLMERQGEESL